MGGRIPAMPEEVIAATAFAVAAALEMIGIYEKCLKNNRLKNSLFSLDFCLHLEELFWWLPLGFLGCGVVIISLSVFQAMFLPWASGDQLFDGSLQIIWLVPRTLLGRVMVVVHSSVRRFVFGPFRR